MQMEKKQTLRQPQLTMMTTAELRPLGWLRRQLEIQAASLSGHLDQFWPDIQDSKWIGGNREGWERVPYWLDGFIPLAFLLEDEDMQARARRYVDAILAGQREDGWICPCEDRDRGGYDTWAALLIGKVLTVWADCSGDERVEPALSRMLRNLQEHLSYHALFDWGRFRWFEGLVPVYWLYRRTGEDWLLSLAHQLKAQGFDYDALFEGFDNSIFTGFHHSWSFQKHTVNLAMALKSGALYSLLSAHEEHTRTASLMLEKLWKYHGTAIGLFTGDETLAGTGPTQGTELCAVCEMLYSLEWLLSITGEVKWGDLLEQICFNALPATFSPDMWTHQYDQMANQVQCSRIPQEHVHFTDNSGEAHLFGLEPHFGCCTANLSQGWPKFALSAFMKGADGLYSTALAPCEVRYGAAKVRLETEYPFRNTLTYTVEAPTPQRFALYIRIPGWAKRAVVDGKEVEAGTFARLEREWTGTSTVSVTLEAETEFCPRPSGLVAIRRGPLFYSLKIGARWEPIDYGPEEKIKVFPHGDYEVFPTTPFAYALTSRALRFEERPLGQFPFDDRTPPVVAHARAVPVDWRASEYGVLENAPRSLAPMGAETEVELVPYGTTTLRVTELPLLERD